jgi:hypothetical protein
MRDGDHILAGFPSNEDQRNATWNALVNLEVPDIDLFTSKSLCSESAKIIVSARADKDDTSAGAGCGHRLIGAFSAGGAVEISAEEGFSRFGESFADDNKVGIRASEEEDPGGFGGGHQRSG